MNRFITPSTWEPKGGIVLEEAAENAVKIDNHLLVIAGPGAGKTELLAQKTDYLFQTNISAEPRKILAISFKKDAADNLKNRISTRYGSEYANRFSSLTYDAFAKRILDHFRNSLPENLKPQKDYVIDDSIVEKVFVDHVMGFSSMKKAEKNAIIEQNLYKTPKQDIWQELLNGTANFHSCLTFKMIGLLAIKIISVNVKIKEALQAKYSHIFLDEFQDTTDLQYRLVKACFLNSRSIIIAVGDNKQRIMEWAGARVTIFDDFQNDFNSEKVSLIMNHRSAPRLVNLQRRMYNSLGESELKAYPSEKWNQNDGEIKLFNSQSEEDEATKIVADIIEKIDNGTKPEEICILVKQLPEKYSNIIIYKLRGKGIRARIENTFQNLLKESIVHLILDFLKVCLAFQRPEEWEELETYWLKSKGIDEIPDENHFEIAQKELKQLIDDCKNQVANILSKVDFARFINIIVDKLSKDSIYELFPEYKQGNLLKQVVSDFVDLFWEGYNQINDFKIAIENFQGKNTIPIMTIHKSKGLEYEAVYFVGLEDSAFWNFRNQPQTDRSAFFVAISRAKKYLSFSCCSNREMLKNNFNPSGNQSSKEINEFFELLQQPGVAEVVD